GADPEQSPALPPQLLQRPSLVWMVIVSTVADDHHRRFAADAPYLLPGEALECVSIVRIGMERDRLARRGQVDGFFHRCFTKLLCDLADFGNKYKGADAFEELLKGVHEQEHHPRDISH